MNMSSFTLRDWSLYIGLYLSWCAVATLIWYFVRRRFRKPLLRAISFGVMFAPGLIPIVREAFIISPAFLALAYLGVFVLVEPVGRGELFVKALQWSVCPMLLMTCVYASGTWVADNLNRRD